METGELSPLMQSSASCWTALPPKPSSVIPGKPDIYVEVLLEHHFPLCQLLSWSGNPVLRIIFLKKINVQTNVFTETRIPFFIHLNSIWWESDPWFVFVMLCSQHILTMSAWVIRWHTELLSASPLPAQQPRFSQSHHLRLRSLAMEIC